MDPLGALAAPNWLGVGESGVATARDMTELVTQFSVRIATSGTTISLSTILYTFTYIFGGGAPLIQELGLFNSLAGADALVARVLTAGLTPASGDELTVNWELYFDIFELS